MVPTSLMMLLFLTVFVLAVGKFYTYYLNGQPGPYGVWLIGLVSALLGLSWPVMVTAHRNSPELSQTYLSLALLLLIAIVVMLLRKTPPRRVRKGLIVSATSERAANQIERERRARVAAARQSAAQPGGGKPAGGAGTSGGPRPRRPAPGVGPNAPGSGL